MWIPRVKSHNNWKLNELSIRHIYIDILIWYINDIYDILIKIIIIKNYETIWTIDVINNIYFTWPPYSLQMFLDLFPSIKIYGASGKQPICQCRLDVRNVGLISGLGRSPGGEHGNYSCLENLMDRGAWQAIQYIKSPRVRHDWSNLALTLKYKCY